MSDKIYAAAKSMISKIQEDKLDKPPLKYLGEGVDRRAFLIQTDKFGSNNKGRVLKIQKHGDKGDLCMDNKREVQTWMKVKGNDIGRYFCPIRNFDENYRYLIMDYAKQIEQEKSAEKAAKRLGQIFSQSDIALKQSIHPANVGLHKELGIVAIDYTWG